MARGVPSTRRSTASETLTRAPELAFVTTKVPDAEAAMLGSARFLGGIPVVIVQNGMQSIETAERVLPDSHVVGGLALYAASFVAGGQVTVTTAGPTYLGAPNPASQEALARASEVLGAVMPVTTTDNFVGAQWTKLVVNQINALPAITGMSAQAVISDRRLRRLLTRSIREVGAGGAGRRGALRPAAGPDRRHAADARADAAGGRAVAAPVDETAHGGDAESRIDAAEHPARSAHRDRLSQRGGRGGRGAALGWPRR